MIFNNDIIVTFFPHLCSPQSIPVFLWPQGKGLKNIISKIKNEKVP